MIHLRTKTYHLFISFAFIISGLSCSEQEVVNENPSRFHIDDLTDIDVVNDLKQTIQIQGGHLTNFNLEWNASRVIIDQETGVETYAVPFTNNSSRFLSFHSVENEMKISVIMEVSFPEEGIQKISYFDFQNNLIGEFRINENDHSISYSLNENLRSEENCGNYTMNCVLWWYESNGWGSVLLVIATAIDPLVSVAVAGACAMNECVLP